MKKLFYLAAAITVMASCTNESIVGDATNGTVYPENAPISFRSTSAAATRADFEDDAAAAKLGNNFVVMGMKSNGTIVSGDAPVFDHYNVNWVTNTANTTTSNTDDWEYVAQTKHAHANVEAQSIKYWDYAKSQYDFIAYSAGEATAVYADGDYVSGTNVVFSAINPSKMNGVDTSTPADGIIDEGAYTVKGTAAQLAKVYIADLVTAYRADNDYQDVVNIKFRSLSAKVRLALYETVPGYSIQGSSVKFYSDATTVDGTGASHLYTTASSSDVFNEEGTYTVYYPTTGYSQKNATDYNKAHLVFTATDTETDKTFGALDATNKYVVREVAETASTTDKLYIGRSSSEATYAGNSSENYYTIVIPNETGVVLNLKVDYTLISTDGSGEVINVTGASAQVPAVYATWKSGYAYTYIFKISQDTNGKTNPALGPAGLYPITFDAVVMNNEVDGIQETITTVATPSITTYAKGAVVTANNEYTAGSNIYVMVNGATLSAANAKLYTVTLTDTDDSDALDKPAQTINEASVANALEHSGTVIDINKWRLQVTAAAGLSIVEEIAAADSPDGNAITTNAAKFTPAAAATYAFEYTDGSGNKYYKIIKVE